MWHENPQFTKPAMKNCNSQNVLANGHSNLWDIAPILFGTCSDQVLSHTHTLSLPHKNVSLKNYYETEF